MDLSTFRHIIANLPEGLELHRQLYPMPVDGRAPRKNWYRSEKEHWLGWLDEYQGPGAYGRQDQATDDAQKVYNRVQSAPMLLWLAEAARIEKLALSKAIAEVKAAGRSGASQCAALRRVIPWSAIAERLD